MIPLLVLLVSFLVFRLCGFGVRYFADWQHALRAALGTMFALTASAHWGRRRDDLVRMVPGVFGDGRLWVTLTGVAELLLVAGLQLPRGAAAVASLGALMLVCIFPANLKAAREGLTLGRRPVPGVGARLAIQAAFLAALALAVWPR